MGREALNKDKQPVTLHLDEDVIEIYDICAPLNKLERKQLMQDVLTEVGKKARRSNAALFKKLKKKNFLNIKSVNITNNKNK